MLLLNGSAPTVPLVRTSANATTAAFLVDSAFTVHNDNGIVNQTSYIETNFLAAAAAVNGPCVVFARDAGGALTGFAEGDIVASIGGGLDAAGTRAALGMAAANLDTQIATLSTLNAAGVRTALGMAAANLDTQIATLSTLDAADVRAALGMAAANLDAQLAAIGTFSAAAIRAAIGMAAADLDAQIAAVIAAIATRSVPGSAMTLTGGERDAIANALLDLASSVETGLTLRKAMRLLGAAMGGEIVQTAPGVWQFTGAGVATARITASIPGDGSRPSMILTL